MNEGSEIKIFSGNSNIPLAKKIAKVLNVDLGLCEVGKFSDGEIYVKIGELVRGQDCFIVNPTSDPVNDNLMEILIMVDALRRASAGRITAVIPYYGYARQDRKTRARDPISARLVADLIQAAGTDRVLAMDMHSEQIQGFFTIPMDHMVGMPLITQYFTQKREEINEDFVVVSPDVGSVKRTRGLAKRLNSQMAIIDKRRPKPNVSEVMNLIGHVEGKNAILMDDMIDTGGTIANAAYALKERGAKRVFATCTHPVLSGSAIERLGQAPIEEIVVLDTIELDKEKQIPKIKQLTTAEIFGSAIKRIHNNRSISELFE